MFESNTDLVEFDEIFGQDFFQPEKSEAPKRTVENLTNETANKKLCIRAKSFLEKINNETPSNFLSKSVISPLRQDILSSPLKKVVLRKFPGPAGLLPERKNFKLSPLEEVNNIKGEEEAKHEEIDICSQLTVKNFREGPWEKMKKDFSSDSNKVLLFLPDKYNIAWIKSKMKLNKLINQKAPFLAAIVQKIECLKLKTAVVTMILRDTTGQIHGTIVHDLYEEYENVLKNGSVVILKQFGVLTTDHGSNHYLTITANNLVTIYSEKNDKVDVTVVQNFSVEDFLRNIVEVRTRHKAAFLEQKLNPSVGGVNLKLRTVSEGNLSNNCRMQTNNNNIFNTPPSNRNCNNFSPIVSNKINSNNKQRFNFKTHNLISKENSSIININNKPKNNSSLIGSNLNTTTPLPFINDNKRLDDDDNNKESVIKCSQISVTSDNLEHTAILQNIFEGVDANFLFEDF